MRGHKYDISGIWINLSALGNKILRLVLAFNCGVKLATLNNKLIIVSFVVIGRGKGTTSHEQK